MSKTGRFLASAAVLALVASVVATASADETQDRWNKKCAVCHGKDGKGDTKVGKKKNVKDLTDPEIRAEFDRERMIKSVTEGIPPGEGSTKPVKKGYAGKLTDEQIAALVDYVFDTLK